MPPSDAVPQPPAAIRPPQPPVLWPVAWSVLVVGLAVLVQAAALFLLGLYAVFDAQPGCGEPVVDVEVSAARVVLALHCLLGLGPWLVAAVTTRRVRWLALGVLASSPAWWGLGRAWLAPQDHFGPWLCF